LPNICKKLLYRFEGLIGSFQIIIPYQNFSSRKTLCKINFVQNKNLLRWGWDVKYNKQQKPDFLRKHKKTVNCTRPSANDIN